MKTRIGSLVVGLALAVLFASAGSLAAGQAKPARNTVVIRDTVKVLGPNGADDHDAPPVLQVLGGQGGTGVNTDLSGNGSAIVFTAGKAGGSSVFGGNGGGIVLRAGNGGDGSQSAGEGGSIRLVAGRAGSSSEDDSGGGSIILRAGEGTCSGMARSALQATSSSSFQ